MVQITGSDTFFSSIDASVAATKWEAWIDQAIDQINGYTTEDLLPNMTGTAGSKTVGLSSREAGWVRAVTVEIYVQYGKNAGASSLSQAIGGISESRSSSTGGAGHDAIQSIAMSAAKALREPDVSYG